MRVEGADRRQVVERDHERRSCGDELPKRKHVLVDEMGVQHVGPELVDQPGEAGERDPVRHVHLSEQRAHRHPERPGGHVVRPLADLRMRNRVDVRPRLQLPHADEMGVHSRLEQRTVQPRRRDRRAARVLRAVVVGKVGDSRS